MWIEQLKNGKYKYFERYKDRHGRTKRVSITLDKNTKQAQNQASKLLLEKIQTRTSRKDETTVTFWELAQQLEEFEKQTAKASTRRTHGGTKRLIKKYIPDDTLLVEVDKIRITEILEELYYKEDYALSYVGGCKTYISNVYKYAIKRGYPVTNQALGISLREKTKTVEEIENEVPKYLELRELLEVLDLAESKNHRLRLFIEFLALTGLRQGEAFGLQYKNWQGNVIHVVGNYDYFSKIKTTPKNRSSYRKVELSDRAIAILNEMKETNIAYGLNKGDDDDYIWVNTRNGNIIVFTTFYRFLESLNYSKKHLTSHIFRHTHISLLAEKNIPLKAIMKRVGHSDPNTTLKIYTHVTEKMEERVIEKLNELPL